METFTWQCLPDGLYITENQGCLFCAKIDIKILLLGSSWFYYEEDQFLNWIKFKQDYFDCYRLLQPGEAFNSDRYCSQLRQLGKEINLMRLVKVTVVYWVVCWLIRRKTRVRVPSQASKRNMKNISSAISSQQISGKNSES